MWRYEAVVGVLVLTVRGGAKIHVLRVPTAAGAAMVEAAAVFSCRDSRARHRLASVIPLFYVRSTKDAGHIYQVSCCAVPSKKDDLLFFACLNKMFLCHLLATKMVSCFERTITKPSAIFCAARNLFILFCVMKKE